MKTSRLILLGVGAALSIASAANASGGCGVNFHRGPYGACRPNYGPGWGPGPAWGPGPGPAVGVFYPGRGYWYGNRYWRNRYAWHGGWRYR